MKNKAGKLFPKALPVLRKSRLYICKKALMSRNKLADGNVISSLLIQYTYNSLACRDMNH